MVTGNTLDFFQFRSDHLIRYSRGHFSRREYQLKVTDLKESPSYCGHWMSTVWLCTGRTIGKLFLLLFEESDLEGTPHPMIKIHFSKFVLPDCFQVVRSIQPTVFGKKGISFQKMPFSKNAFSDQRLHNYLKLMSWGFHHRIERPLLSCCVKRQFDSFFQKNKDLCFFDQSDQKWFWKLSIFS